MKIFGTQVGNRSRIFFANIAKLLTAKHEQNTAVSSFTRRRDAMDCFITGVRKSMIFTVFYFLRSPGKNCHLRKILSLSFTAMELSYDVCFKFDDFDLTTTRSLAIDVCICLNHRELSSFAACLSFCWLEEI